MKGLLDVTSKTVANMLKGKGVYTIIVEMIYVLLLFPRQKSRRDSENIQHEE